MSIGVLLVPAVLLSLTAASKASASVPSREAWGTVTAAGVAAVLLAVMILDLS